METRRVLALGAYDLLHWGHLRFVRQAQTFGEVVVGLSTDKFLAETKKRPVLPYPDRAQGLIELGCEVLPRNEVSAVDLFLAVDPDLFVCGNDWLERGHLDSAGLSVGFLNEEGVGVLYLPRSHTMSTSSILETLGVRP